MLVFPRDKCQGDKICRALEERYNPSLVFYQKEKLGEILDNHELMVAVMATGIVVRSLCPYLKDKWTDKPVVAVDSSLKCAVPIVGGHHGANDLAFILADKLGLFPAVTTATDAAGRPSLESIAALTGAEITNRKASKELNLAFLRQEVPVLRLRGPKIVIVDDDVAILKIKGLVVGLGARKGVSEREVLEALDFALKESGYVREEIAILATAWLKREEKGIAQAARTMGKEVLYLSKEVLNAQSPSSPSRARDLGLSGVAEPAVLALANELIMPKKAYGRVTVALGK